MGVKVPVLSNPVASPSPPHSVQQQQRLFEDHQPKVRELVDEQPQPQQQLSFQKGQHKVPQLNHVEPLQPEQQQQQQLLIENGKQ